MPGQPPFGHDPKDPPWQDIKSSPAEPVPPPPDDLETVAARRIFRNTQIPEPNVLQITATENITDPGSNDDRPAVQERLLRLLDSFEAYFTTFDPGSATPAEVDFGKEPDRQPLDEEADPPFANIRELDEGIERLTIIELRLLPSPRKGDPLLAVGVTIHPDIAEGALHGYVAKCTTSAWASVYVYSGRIRLRMFRKGVSIAVVEAGAGQTGGPIGRNTATRATFDIAVRGLASRSSYNPSVGWVRGTGGGC
jgi:hypothetical protein